MVVRKYRQKKGGIKIDLPSNLNKLLDFAIDLLKVKVIKIRESPPTEAEIIDINSVSNGQILYFTTKEDEKEFEE